MMNENKILVFKSPAPSILIGRIAVRANILAIVLFLLLQQYLNTLITLIKLFMKKLTMPLMAFALLFVVSCNSGSQTDSTTAAEEKNEQKTDASAAKVQVEDDNEFAVEAASGGLMEVELGTIAAQNASSPKVKEFGQRMVRDHSKANEELKAIAMRKNITLPTTPGDKHQHHIDELKAKKGADFDKAYMSMMVEDHNEDIKKFENEGQTGKDADIKAFAAGKVTVLKEHLEMAKATNDAVKQ